MRDKPSRGSSDPLTNKVHHLVNLHVDGGGGQSMRSIEVVSMQQHRYL